MDTEDGYIDSIVVTVDFKNIVDEDSKTDIILKDLLDLPEKKSEKVLQHPIILLFIEQRWQKTKWMFLISFLSYLLFLLVFSTFLGLMYFREPSRQIRLASPLQEQMCLKTQSLDKGMAKLYLNQVYNTHTTHY